MLSNLLQAIKGEKQLSFNHWRYRLLHWVLCVNPTSPADSTLPKMFYTHYCPLFHLTNLMAAFLWLIIPCRIVIFIGLQLAYYGSIFGYVAGKLFDKFIYLRFFPDEIRRRARTQEEIDFEEQAIAREKEIDLLHVLYSNTKKAGSSESFDKFWYNWGFRFDLLTWSKAKEEWESYHAKVQERLKEAEEYRKNRYDEMIFLINFSRICLKGGMYTFYFTVGILMAYVLAAYIIPGIVWLAYMLLTVDWLWVGGWVIRIMVSIAVFVGLVALLVKGARNKSASKYIAPPLVLTGDILKAGWQWADGSFENFKSFIALFYEENCPPIKIIDTAPATEAVPE